MSGDGSYKARAVIVIGRNRVNRDTLTDILEQEGFASVSAANGDEALGVLKSVDYPCLVLVDAATSAVGELNFIYDIRKESEFRKLSHKVMLLAEGPETDAATLPMDINAHDGLKVLRSCRDTKTFVEAIERHCCRMDEGESF
jgi:CheY-like chemotaxis protein